MLNARFARLFGRRRALQRLRYESTVASEGWKVNLRGEDWLKGPRPDHWYTGKKPVYGECPGVLEDGTFTSLALPRLDRVTRKHTQVYFDNTWTATELLFAGLDSEEYFFRPPLHGLRHPQIFYYGHSPCLYVNSFRAAGLLDRPVNAYFESDVFKVGVDEMRRDDMEKNEMVWPTVEETRQYRQEVYNRISDIIANHPGLGEEDSPSTVQWNDPLWALFLGFEHDRIHLETSSVLFREAPLHLVQSPQAWPKAHPSSTRPEVVSPVRGQHYPDENMLAVEGGKVQLGKPRSQPSYGWDNEYGSRVVDVPPFSASKYMVTNGDFLEFVKADGYRTERFWPDDGWAWRKSRNINNPLFWDLDGSQGSVRYKLRNIYDTVEMQWDWPVEVNNHEARAYCNWRSQVDNTKYRFPTEAEYNLLKDPSVSLEAARAEPDADPVLTRSGADFANDHKEVAGANLNFAFGTPSPVGGNGLPSATGHCDVAGNLWEHILDTMNPFDSGTMNCMGRSEDVAFEVHPYYDDFTTHCFDGKHDLILGGSFMSTGHEASTFARFHFRRHFLQFAGFRLVYSEQPPVATRLPESGAPTVHGTGSDNVYETQTLVDMYLDLHFPGREPETHAPVPFMMPHDGLPDQAQRFPQRVAELVFNLAPEVAVKESRALDLGCAVGGSSFTLATQFGEVVGVDFSHAFIDAANEMKGGNGVHFELPMEGDLGRQIQAHHEDGVDAEIRGRTSFQQGDACNLPENALGTFDAVVMANLLCRLPRPDHCLDSLSRMVRAGGVFVMTTPFSWLEQFTDREHWMGGFVDPATGKEMHSDANLEITMGCRGFTKIYDEPMPLVIREHMRKYQYIISKATGWLKNE